jgi:hypothetical protein
LRKPLDASWRTSGFERSSRSTKPRLRAGSIGRARSPLRRKPAQAPSSAC